MMLSDAIAAFVDRDFARETEFLAELVKVPSDNPPGDCAAHAKRARQLLERFDLAVEAHEVPRSTVEAFCYNLLRAADRAPHIYGCFARQENIIMVEAGHPEVLAHELRHADGWDHKGPCHSSREHPDGVKLDGTDFGGGPNTTVISQGNTVGIPLDRFQSRGVYFGAVYAVSGDGFTTVNPSAAG